MICVLGTFLLNIQCIRHQLLQTFTSKGQRSPWGEGLSHSTGPSNARPSGKTPGILLVQCLSPAEESGGQEHKTRRKEAALGSRAYFGNISTEGRVSPALWLGEGYFDDKGKHFLVELGTDWKTDKHASGRPSGAESQCSVWWGQQDIRERSRHAVSLEHSTRPRLLFLPSSPQVTCPERRPGRNSEVGSAPPPAPRRSATR